MTACRECRHRAQSVAFAKRDVADLARRLTRKRREVTDEDRATLVEYKARIATATAYLAEHESECAV